MSGTDAVVFDQGDEREIRSKARVIERALPTTPIEVTVADAATRSGLTLEQADKALNWLLTEYRGRLAVGSQGDLIYRFPYGFSKPWQTRETLKNVLISLWRRAQPIIKIALKIWILVVIVLYVVIFLAIMIGLLFASKGRSSDDRRQSDRGFGGFLVVRLLLELVYDAFWAMFWFGGMAPKQLPHRSRRDMDARRFYQEVFQFIFGPEEPQRDPRADQKKLLTYIRAQRGRVVVGDVVALLGCSIPEAEKVLTRLSVDYNGEVSVDDTGSIIFSFPEVLKTVAQRQDLNVAMSWENPLVVSPLTGNKPGANLAIVVLNGFNLVMSIIAMGSHLTLKNVMLLYNGVPLNQLPSHETAIFLGVIPFIFSTLIFLVPVGRWLGLRRKIKRALQANSVRAIVREVFEKLRFIISSKELTQIYLAQGRKGNRQNDSNWSNLPDENSLPLHMKQNLNDLALDLEADLDLTDEGALNYHFQRFEREYHSVQKLRQTIPKQESSVGDIVFE